MIVRKHLHLVTGASHLDNRKAALNRRRVARTTLRHRFNVAPARIDYDGRIIDGLIRAGLLTEAQANDQQAINYAISRFLADMFLADDLKNFLNAVRKTESDRG